MAALALTFAACGEDTEATSTDPAGTYQIKTLVRGAPIHGANGLAVDQEGRLLVASANGGEIVVLDTRTGTILERLGVDSSVDVPDDVAVAPDGSIYWTDIQIGEVGRRTPGGSVTKQRVAFGVNPVTVSSDGRVFVAQAFWGDGVYELDPELTEPPEVLIPDSGTPPFVEQLNGFDFGPDGMLYAPQPFKGQIIRIDPDTGEKTTIAQGLDNPPTSVEFDSLGNLYVTLRYEQVIRVDLETGDHEVVAEISGLVADNMAFDARDRMFVSDSDKGAVYTVARGGGVRTLSKGGLILPGGVALVEDQSGGESLFVGDFWRLVQLDPRSGRELGEDGITRLPGSIVESHSVAADGGNLILTSWMSNAVQIWDPVDSEEVERFDDFAVPLNAIRFQGDLVVAQLGNQAQDVPPSVVRMDAAGTLSVLAENLQVPSGLAATDGDLWVADWAAGRVFRIVAGGEALNPAEVVAEGLDGPEGMAVDDGSLLVVESGKDRLIRVDTTTGEVSTVVDGLELGVKGSAGAPPAWALCGVAVGEDSTIYVTGDLGSVVYRIR
ncbi:MAG TPA: hypothetical protein VFZ64_16830, partial [Nocardioidaceae bacterium]